MWTSDVAIRIPPPYESVSERANLGKAEKNLNAGNRPNKSDPEKIITIDQHFAASSPVICTK